MTLKNNRAPPLCYFKLCASFRSYWWIQTGVTVRKRPIWVKINDFFSHVTLKFDGWPWKTIGHLFYVASSFIVLCDKQIWWMTLKNDRASLLCCFKLYASFHSHQWIQTKVTVRKRSIWVKIGNFFVPCDLEIWWMTLKNNRAPPLCYFKLCASFRSYWWIQTGVTVRKRPIWVKINDFFSHVTLKFDGWPWKTIGHLFYVASSFIVLCDKQIWWMTLKNDRASLLCCFKLYASFHSHQWIQTKVTVRKRSIWVKIGNFFVPCDLEIWWMTLKNNRAPPLCYFKLCASFRSYWWIQTGVTVRKRPIWVKINDFFSRVTLKFDGWPWKTIGHLS